MDPLFSSNEQQSYLLVSKSSKLRVSIELVSYMQILTILFFFFLIVFELENFYVHVLPYYHRISCSNLSDKDLLFPSWCESNC